MSVEEEYFRDHFPYFPVLPGVLIVEGCVQLAGWLVGASTGFSHTARLLRVPAFRFARPVQPGALLSMSVSCLEWCAGSDIRFRSRAAVDGVDCARGDFVVELHAAGDAAAFQVEFERLRRRG